MVQLPEDPPLVAEHPWFELAELAASERSAGKAYGEAAHWLEGDLPSDVANRQVVACDASSIDSTIVFRLEEPTVAADALVFGRGDEEPFHAATLYRRADSAWRAEGLTDRPRLHQARHTYASFMIAAGVNAKALSQFMGHSSIKVTEKHYAFLDVQHLHEAVERSESKVVQIHSTGTKEGT